MLYIPFGKFGNVVGKLVKAVALVLDIANLLRLLIGPTTVGIVVAVIAHIREMPWWAITLFFLVIFFIAVSATVFAIRKSSGNKQLLKYPNILRALDNRNRKLALKKARQPVDEVKLRQFEKDFAELFRLTPISPTAQHLSRRRMTFLEKKIKQQVPREKSLKMFSNVIDANDLGLKEMQEKDFIFRYYKAQLEDMPIPPNPAINDAIENCTIYSNRYNTVLIFDERYRRQMKDAVPIEYFLRNIGYANFAKSRVRGLITVVNEAIEQYLRDTTKQKTKTAQ